MNQSIPAGVEIQVEVRFVSNGELIQQGILSVGEQDEVKELRLAGLAAQRGVYELLQSLFSKFNSTKSQAG